MTNFHLETLIREFELDKIVDDDPEVCKGLVFRCERTAWFGIDQDINFRRRFRLLKRKSCPGCSKCDWMWDDLSERFSDFGSQQDGIDYDDCEHGKLYELQTTDVSYDYESGFVDSYNMKFVEVKEDKEKK